MSKEAEDSDGNSKFAHGVQCYKTCVQAACDVHHALDCDLFHTPNVSSDDGRSLDAGRDSLGSCTKLDDSDALVHSDVCHIDSGGLAMSDAALTPRVESANSD